MATPRNLGVIRRKYPGLCPYQVAHNVLGGHFDRHDACTAAPFCDGVCVHGSHSDPARSAEARGCKDQTAKWKILQLALGFSRRAGSTKLHDGCAECNEEESLDVACMSCGRAWQASRRKGSRPVAADYAACNATYRRELDRRGGEGGGRQYQGSQQEEEEQEGPYGGQYHGGNGYDQEEDGGYGYDEEEDWEGGYHGDGGEGDDGEEDSEYSSESSSGEAEPPAKRTREEYAPSTTTPITSAAQPSEVSTLRLQLEASQANVRALQAELKLAKNERDAALARP
jgi:hypothetical protein